MKFSLSKSTSSQQQQQLRNETPKSKGVPLILSNSSQHKLQRTDSSQNKQQLTDSSLVQLGSEFYSKQKQQQQVYPDDDIKQQTCQTQNIINLKEVQQHIQNTQIDKQLYLPKEQCLTKEQQLKQIIKQIYTPSSNTNNNAQSRNNEQNNNNMKNINLPQLTFVSVDKEIVKQQQQQQQKTKKQKQGQVKTGNIEQIKHRATSNDRLELTKSQQQKAQISQFDEHVRRLSLVRNDSHSSQEKTNKNKKNRSKMSTPSSQNGQQNTPSFQMLSSSNQARPSVFDLNQAKNKYISDPNQYLTNDYHHSCLMPYKSESNSLTAIPNLEQSKVLSNKHANNEYSNSSSPQQSRLADSSSKVSLAAASKTQRKECAAAAISTANHSQNSNATQQYTMNGYNSTQPIQVGNFIPTTPLSQTASQYSSMNNNQQVSSEYNTQDRTAQLNYQIKSRMEAFMQDLKNKDKEITQIQEINGRRVNELERLNEDVRDKCEFLEKENEKLRHIMREQEQVMSRMKDLYTSIGNEDIKYNSNNNLNESNERNSNQGRSIIQDLQANNNSINDLEYHQIKLKNEQQSILIKVLQETISDLEFKNKELQADINNLIHSKEKLEQDILKPRPLFMGSIHSPHIIQEDGDQIKHSKQNYNNIANHLQPEQDCLTQSPQIIKSSKIKQNPIDCVENFQVIEKGKDIYPSQNRKMDDDNESLLGKIEDLECQLHQVYKSLNSSPSKSYNNLDFNLLQQQQQEHKIYYMTGSNSNAQGFIEQSQIANGTYFSYEMVKQQQIDIENLKNALKAYQNQIVLWQERYNNLDIVHQDLLKDKTKYFTQYEKFSEIDTNKEKMSEIIQNLSSQIEDMNMLLKEQNSDILFLKMNLSQKNGELSELQLRLESRETTTQMVKKRMNELEEQNIQIASQKGQLKVQIKQLQDLFDNQKSELQNVYSLLKTRNLDTDNIQKQYEDIQCHSRKQQMTIQSYEKEMDEMAGKNCNLQNQVYDLLHQQTAVNSANNMLSRQIEMNSHLMNSYNTTDLGTASKSKANTYDGFITNIRQKGYQTPVSDKFVINSQDYIQSSMANTVPILRNQFGNDFKHLADQNSHKHGQNQFNQVSYQNGNNQNNCLPLLHINNNNINNTNQGMTSNISDFELTKSKIDENLITQNSNYNDKSVYISQ